MRTLFQKLRQDDSISPVQRLLVLLAVDAGAVVVAGAAAGTFHFTLFNALVAAVAAIAAVTSLPAARRWFTSPPPPGTPESSASLARTKKVLVLVMAAGAIAYVGGRGTFAIFTAETSNLGNGMTSGTLVLSDVNNTTGTTCYSYNGPTADNVNSGCGSILNLTNMAPGVSTAQTQLTIKNTGSLDASVFELYAPYPRTALTGALTAGQSIASTLAVSGFNVPVAANDVIMISEGNHSQSFKVAAAAKGATTLAGVTSATPGVTTYNYSYDVNARVEETNGDTSPTNSDCYDTVTTASTVPVSGATPGTSLPFVTNAGNPLCSSALFWVQEQTTIGATTLSYCWAGRGAVGSAAPASNGQCRTPTTAALTAALPSTSGTANPTTSITVGPLTGNIQNGDAFTIAEGANTDTFQATADAYIGATTISVASVSSSTTPWSPNFVYDASATIKDTTAFDKLNGDSVDTISNFDTANGENHPLHLYPLTSNTTTPNTLATVSLGKYGTTGTTGAGASGASQRTFFIGVYMPAPSATTQNQLQGLISTFGLTWHIEQ